MFWVSSWESFALFSTDNRFELSVPISLLLQNLPLLMEIVSITYYILISYHFIQQLAHMTFEIPNLYWAERREIIECRLMMGHLYWHFFTFVQYQNTRRTIVANCLWSPGCYFPRDRMTNGHRKSQERKKFSHRKFSVTTFRIHLPILFGDFLLIMMNINIVEIS